MFKIQINNSEELVQELQTEIKFHLHRLDYIGFHFTQEGIARYVGITQPNISRILNSPDISVEKVVDLATRLGLEINFQIVPHIDKTKIKQVQTCMNEIKKEKKEKRKKKNKNQSKSKR